MTNQRLTPQQILTDVPLDAAREACWRALVSAGVSNVLIDREKNLVVGSTSANLGSYGQNVTARFEPQANGTQISVKSEAQVQGTIDFGRSKRHAKTMADAIEAALSGNLPPLVSGESAAITSGIAPPIAAPTGEIHRAGVGGPVYGVAMPPKRGTAVLIYGLLSISCCQIAGPFAWVYGSRALKEYGNTDPGDKTMVRIGWVLGIIGTAILILRLAYYAFALTQGRF